MKTLLVLLPCCFEVAGLLFLTLGLSLRFLLLLEFHGLGKGNFSFGVESFGINKKLKATGERRADKIEGILRIFPRSNGLLLHVISLVRRGIDLRLDTCRRAVLRRNGLHHVLRGESFRGSSIVSYENLVELAVVEREKKLFDGIRLERSPGKVRRPPSQFLNQRWTAMNHRYIGHLLVSTLQHSGQAHSKGKVPILGKILSTKKWRRKEQDNKTKNRTAHHFHFHISHEFLSTR